MTATRHEPHVGHIAGVDFLQQDAIRAAVRGAYADVRPTDRAVAERFYAADELDGLPEDTIRMALGVGNPVRHAALITGQTVLDLGSGGGIDCLLAARAVGPAGRVVGIDFLPEMLERATRAAADIGLDNVDFVEGEIEALPLPDASVDVVISNGVINLSPRKVRVLAEAFRVLRPGGRLAVVDLVLEHDLPPEIVTSPAAWAGCLSGALSETALYKGLRRAGFREVGIRPLHPFGIAECALYPLFNDELLSLLGDRVPAERHGRIAQSVFVTARKPALGEDLPGRARESERGRQASYRHQSPLRGTRPMTQAPAGPRVDTAVLREAIRTEYEAVATDPTRGFHFHTGRPLARLLGYPDALLAGLPEDAIASMAGTGNPFALGPVGEGQRVVDAGSGAGVDSIIAGRLVGPTGAVIGVDMTEGMLRKARAAAAAAGATNVEFRGGYLEALPVNDGWADLVISNGVLNLVPDKAAALAEMHRVLRPGGRLQLADIVLGRPVSDDAKQDVSLWTGCIAGGLSRGDLAALVAEAGFGHVQVLDGIDVFADAPQHSNAAAFGTIGAGIRARKPASA